jgi:hypothetical protein
MNPDEYCTSSTVPYYEKRDIYFDTLVKKYTIFKQSVKRRHSDMLLESHDCIKPDGSKIVQFMVYMGQINTIDTEMRQVIGYRSMEKYSDFSSFSKFPGIA